MRPRTTTSAVTVDEWDELTGQRTVREVWNIPASAMRRVARVVLGTLGAAILVVAVLRWVT